MSRRDDRDLAVGDLQDALDGDEVAMVNVLARSAEPTECPECGGDLEDWAVGPRGPYQAVCQVHGTVWEGR